MELLAIESSAAAYILERGGEIYLEVPRAVGLC
jgi:hypothetical protein